MELVFSAKKIKYLTVGPIYSTCIDLYYNILICILLLVNYKFEREKNHRYIINTTNIMIICYILVFHCDRRVFFIFDIYWAIMRTPN